MESITVHEPISIKATVAFAAATVAAVGFVVEEARRVLVAELPVGPVTQLAPDVANLTALGAVIFLCWYQVTKAFPKLLEDARAERDSLRAQNHEDMMRLTEAMTHLAERINHP